MGISFQGISFWGQQVLPQLFWHHQTVKRHRTEVLVVLQPPSHFGFGPGKRGSVLEKIMRQVDFSLNFATNVMKYHPLWIWQALK